MSYKLDHQAIDDLAREWGVEGAIEVRRVKRRRDPRTGLLTIRANQNGRHKHHVIQWPNGHLDQRHVIVLDSGRPAFFVAQTLAHELCHAVQASAAVSGGDAWGWHRRHKAERRIPYRERPIEVEAREWGWERADEVLDRCLKVTPEVRQQAKGHRAVVAAERALGAQGAQL